MQVDPERLGQFCRNAGCMRSGLGTVDPHNDVVHGLLPLGLVPSELSLHVRHHGTRHPPRL